MAAGLRPDRAFAFHLWPGLPAGQLGGCAGVQLAAADYFDVTISGVGGHAAMPHLAVDPVVAAAAAVGSLQTLVSRGLSPLDAGVLSVTKFAARRAPFRTPPRRSLADRLALRVWPSRVRRNRTSKS